MSLNLYQYHSDAESLNGFDEYMHQNPDVAYEIALSRGYASEQLEDAIATSAWFSHIYAQNVIKGSWPPGEKAIATDAWSSYRYAKHVIQGPWPPGEKAIAGDAWASFWYAQDVLGERFLEGEPAIRGSEYQQDYEQRFGIKL